MLVTFFGVTIAALDSGCHPADAHNNPSPFRGYRHRGAGRKGTALPAIDSATIRAATVGKLFSVLLWARESFMTGIASNRFRGDSFADLTRFLLDRTTQSAFAG